MRRHLTGEEGHLRRATGRTDGVMGSFMAFFVSDFTISVHNGSSI